MFEVSSRLIAASVLGIALTAPAVMAAPLLSDDFEVGSVPNPELWSTFSSYSGGTSTLDGHDLVLRYKSTAASNYTGTVTNSSSFDAFHGMLTIALDDIGFGTLASYKADATTKSPNTAWVIYGRSNTNTATEYRATKTQMAYGVGTIISALSTGFQLTTVEYADGGQTTHVYQLGGAPTDLTLEIDGANHSLQVSLGGTTFDSTNSNTITQSLSTDNFVAENYSVGNTVTSRISLGIYNGYGVDSPSTFSVGAITASVPEPASLGLVAGGAILLTRRRRRS